MYRDNYEAIDTVSREKEAINKVKQRLKDEEDFKKRLEAWNSKVPVYFAEVPAITYADCIDLILSKGKKEVIWTQDYHDYRKLLFEKLKEQRIVKIPEQIKFLRLDLEIFISYAQRDVDNVEKPFIDRLFEFIGRDDNCIKCISKSNVVKVDQKNQEGVYFKITGITEDEFVKSQLSVQYENQMKEKKFQNKKPSIRMVR